MIKYCNRFNLGAKGRKDDLKNRVRGHWFTMKGSEMDLLDRARTSQLDRVVVVNAESDEQIVDLEDLEVESDSDEIVNFEQFSSESEFEEDDMM